MTSRKPTSPFVLALKENRKKLASLTALITKLEKSEAARVEKEQLDKEKREKDKLAKKKAEEQARKAAKVAKEKEAITKKLKAAADKAKADAAKPARKPATPKSGPKTTPNVAAKSVKAVKDFGDSAKGATTALKNTSEAFAGVATAKATVQSIATAPAEDDADTLDVEAGLWPFPTPRCAA